MMAMVIGIGPGPLRSVIAVPLITITTIRRPSQGRRSQFLLPLHLSCSRSSCALLQLPSVVQRSASKPTISALPLSFTTSSPRGHLRYNDGGVETSIRSSSSSASRSAAGGSSRGRRNRTNTSSSNRHVDPSEYVKQRLGLTPPSLPCNVLGHLPSSDVQLPIEEMTAAQIYNQCRPNNVHTDDSSMKNARRDDSSMKNARRRRRRPPSQPPLPGQPGRGNHRNSIQIGADVFVVQKNDQRSGVETAGIVSRHLTNSPYHPRGIKVMLTTGRVGRVTRIVNDMDPGMALNAGSVE